MAGSVNKAIVVGNVGGEPEIRSTQDGSKIANFSLATSEGWKDKLTGERKDKTEWHRIVVFNPNLVDVVEKYVRKGTKLYVEGQLQTRQWTDKEGKERYSTEIVLSRFRGDLTILTPKGEGGGSADFDGGHRAVAGQTGGSIHDDEIPF
ncbi:MAG: single-stranded DNA-binding protein [Pseudomonadota bacterium]